MEIGQPEKEITVEPLEDPVPREIPVEPEKVEVEAVMEKLRIWSGR